MSPGGYHRGGRGCYREPRCLVRHPRDIQRNGRSEVWTRAALRAGWGNARLAGSAADRACLRSGLSREVVGGAGAGDQRGGRIDPVCSLTVDQSRTPKWPSVQTIAR